VRIAVDALQWKSIHGLYSKRGRRSFLNCGQLLASHEVMPFDDDRISTGLERSASRGPGEHCARRCAGEVGVLVACVAYGVPTLKQRDQVRRRCARLYVPLIDVHRNCERRRSLSSLGWPPDRSRSNGSLLQRSLNSRQHALKARESLLGSDIGRIRGETSFDAAPAPTCTSAILMALKLSSDCHPRSRDRGLKG
jgi:hypothetical protein